MNISQNGINLIKRFEGVRLDAYKPLPTESDWTIGYGHCASDVHEGETITLEYAETLLKKDLKKFEDGVNELVDVPITQNQFDALCSFAFNLGLGCLKTSSLLMHLNRKEFNEASDCFILFVHAGGKVIQGLVNRRKAEQALFNKANPKPTKPVHETTTYKVELGDNLTKIAKDHNTTVDVLDKLNPQIENINRIYPNQIINVPFETKPVGEVVPYKVKSGDNLTKIAKEHKTTVDVLMSLNPKIEDKDLIYPSQYIKVPK